MWNDLLPIFLGGLIGYTTNVIAIRMLFRPHKAWHIGRFRVPMTPGIIPKYRAEFASQVGVLVSGLIHSGVLREHFESKKVHGLVRGILDRIFEGGGSRSGLRFLLKVYGLMKKAIYVWGLDLLRGGRVRGVLKEIMGEYLKGLQGGGGKQEELLSWLELKWKELRRSRVGLRRLLGMGFEEYVLSFVEKEWFNFLDEFKKVARQSGLLEHLNRRFKRLIIEYIEGLGVVQRFVAMGLGLEAKLDRDLPELIEEGLEEVFESLKKEKFIEELMIKLGVRIDIYLGKTLGEVLSEIDGKDYEKMGKGLMGVVRDFLDRGDWEGWVFEDIWEHFLDEGSREEIYEKIFGRVFDEIEGGLLKGGGGVLKGLREGKILDWMARELLRVLKGEVNGVVRGLDLKELMEEKVNELSIEEMEGLLLKLIRRHVRWIHIFGALLGVLIGGLQLIFRG